MSKPGRKKLKLIDPAELDDEEIEFMYYPDIDSDNFYPHIWSKKEFYENRSPVREYYEDPVKKKKLLQQICSSDVLQLKNHQVFLRNFLSPETPYNSILVYHGVGTGKCLLPGSEVYLNGTLIPIEQIWKRYKVSDDELDFDEDNGMWSEVQDKLIINSFDEVTKKIIEYPIKRLYRQHIKENIVVLEIENGETLKLTKQHHLLTENGWSNDFINNQFVINNEVKLLKIKKVYEEFYDGFVYDLEVEHYHNYVANGIVCHNTCAGVTVAEGLKETVEKYNKKIYVIANQMLLGNFRRTLYNIDDEKRSKFPGSMQCTKTTYYIPKKKKESPEERKLREKEIREMQKKYYTYMGYIMFVNFVEKEVIGKGLDVGEYFSNSVFIIDEAHNLIARSGSKNKGDDETRKTRETLHNIFKVSKNTKLVLMSATPITNEINDIIVLVNLLRANDNKKIYQPTDLSTDGNSQLTAENLNINKFNQYIKGYISYFRGAHPSSFPEMEMINTYNRTVKADMFGDALSEKLPQLKDFGLIECEMSPFHFYNYFQELLELEKNSLNVRSRDSRGDQLKIMAGTVFYPLEDPDDARIGTFRMDEVFIKEKSKGKLEKYKYRTKEYFLNVDSHNEKYLHQTKLFPSIDNTVGEPLSRYSTKFYRMFYDIVNTYGINFVFTRFKVDTGTISMSLLLEQNGYIRYHETLGKPNEFTGKYREKVNNHLNIKNLKYRCVCGYLDEDHDLKYSGKNNYKNPRKHRFLQGTYLRVDGDTSDKWEDLYSGIVNSQANEYGHIIKVIVGGVNMREGINLKNVRSVHIMNPWHNLIQIEQTIGRASRLCSHAGLDVDEMNVRVFKYADIPPQGKLPRLYSLKKAIKTMEDENKIRIAGVKFNNKSAWLNNIESSDPSDWSSIDEYIYSRALNKDYNIKFAERLMKKSSVDCYLNLAANLSFPYDVDGSRECDYTDCKYTCNADFDPPKNLNLDTYDLYFMEPKVQNAQEIIGSLFTNNWALTLKSVTELAQKEEPSLTRDVIYLALNRMLGDLPRLKPTPVVDQYDRFGYIIYKHPFYIYQPKEVFDEGLPMYNRKLPSRGKKTEIDIKSIITPGNKTIVMRKPLFKESLSKSLGNISSSGSKMTQTKFASQIEAMISPVQNQDKVTLEGVLDYLSNKQHEYLIKTRIEEWCSGSRDPYVGHIITYYLENYYLAHPKMTYNQVNDTIDYLPTTPEWVYNMNGKFMFYHCAEEKWTEVHEDSDIMLEIKERYFVAGPQFLRLERPMSPVLYAYLYDDNKKKEIKMKITDIDGQQVKTKRYSEDTNIKTLSRGQVCVNYSNEQLEDFCDRLKVKYDLNLQRNSLCSLIERELRIRDIKDKKYIWFLNFPNYKRKFDKLEEKDRRSFISFYLT